MTPPLVVIQPDIYLVRGNPKRAWSVHERVSGPSAGVVVLIPVLRGRARVVLGHDTSLPRDPRPRVRPVTPCAVIPAGQVHGSLRNHRQRPGGIGRRADISTA